MNYINNIHPSLIDDHQRVMRKLRVSLLDACNFRCTYCMPENAEFAKSHNLLSPNEIQTIVKNMVNLGIEEVRLTGGEPTLRSELVTIAHKLSEVDLKKLSMTTNGLMLKKFLKDLSSTQLKSLNISLDSLVRNKFHQITRFDGLSQVLESIFLAKELGFHVKINTVILKNQNLDEIEAFIEFSKKYDIEVRFLELINIGVAVDFFKDEFVMASDLIHSLRKKHNLKSLSVSQDSTSFKYLLDDKAQIGFIASESLSFCHSCSRLRLDSKGNLRACLMKEDKVSLRNLEFSEYPQLVHELILKKPFERIDKLSQPMYQIGG